MEPKLPTPHFQPERLPSSQPSMEQIPGSTPEVSPEKAREDVERSHTQDALATPVLPPVAVAPTPTVASLPNDTATVSDTPLVAADEDLIEKEWVDKAKKIVEETKDDPYRREQEVGKLQADYLRKRYGKELGASQ